MRGRGLNENYGAIDHPPPTLRRSSSNDTFISASINWNKEIKKFESKFFFLFLSMIQNYFSAGR
jgi:hypothetical protein